MIRFFARLVIGTWQTFDHRPSSCSRDRAAPVVFLRESGALQSAISSLSYSARALRIEGVAEIAWKPYTSSDENT